jgi:hypothetical protein
LLSPLSAEEASQNQIALKHFTLEIVTYGGHSPPAPIPRQGFAGKSLQSRYTFSMSICSNLLFSQKKICLGNTDTRIENTPAA